MKNNASGQSKLANAFYSLTKKILIVDRQRVIFNVLAVLCLVLFVWLSYLLFDVKASDAGDDTNYIEMAFRLWHQGNFPVFQGPLYPLVLAPFVGAFGVNLILLKSLSCIFLTAFIGICYINFRKIMPTALLLLIILFLSVNRSIIYYASQTFSEGLYVLFTAFLIFFFNKYFIAKNNSSSTKKIMLHYIVVALFILCCFLTRTAGIACLGAVLVYFILYRQWKNLLYISISFIGIFLIYSLIKKVAFTNVDVLHFYGQLKLQAQKDAYNPAGGYEGVGGFLSRFWGNSEQFLGGHLLVILGLEPTDYVIGILQKGGLVPVTIFIYIIILVSLWFSFRTSKLVFFAALLSVMGMVVAFFFLQVSWNQERNILVYVPYLMILFAYSFYWFFNKNNIISAGKWIPFICFVVVIAVSFKRTFVAVNDFSEERREVATGRILYGFTTDFQNYIVMSAWAAAHVGKDTMIACRKPSISFVYGRRPFFGIFSVPTINEMDVLNYTAGKEKREYAVSLQTLEEPNTSEMFKRYRKFADILVSWQLPKVVLAQQSNPSEPLNTVLFSIPDSLTNYFEKTAIELKIAYDTSTQAVFHRMHNLHLEPSAYSFRELLANLQTNNVHYLILASLRSKPSENTGNIITTLHTYANLLGLKYPDLFTPVKTIGTDENASLIRINYSR